MTEVLPNVISIGYGRHMFVQGNPERTRMEACALETGEFHMVIFTRHQDGLTRTTGQNNLMLHPTNSYSRLLMVSDAFLCARTIIKSNKDKKYIVTSQDPFEAGVVGYLLKKLYGTRLVVQEHGDVFSSSFWRRESLLNQFRYMVGEKILRVADVIRVVSKRTKEYLKAQGHSHITLLPVAIDAKQFREAIPSLLIREHFSADNFVFLSVARFVKQKNVPLLISAFHKAFLKCPQARLLLVGIGPEESELKALTKELFKEGESPIVFIPWSDNVAGLMKAADAYALSSNYEGWGRVLIEAMVSGLPIVTTDVGCAGEVVMNGVHGIVTPVGDVETMTEALIHMVDDTDFYGSIKQNLGNLSLVDIPGTNISDYGKEWVKTLEM